MSTADIIILLAIILPGIVGVFYGFLNIVFSLFSWVISVGLAVKLVPYFSPLLEQYVDILPLRITIAFVGLLIVGLLIMNSLFFFIVKLLNRTGMTASDRILGLFCGIGLGGLFVFVIVFLAGFTALPTENWWSASSLVKPFERISIWSSHYLPESFQRYHAYSQDEIEQ